MRSTNDAGPGDAAGRPASDAVPPAIDPEVWVRLARGDAPESWGITADPPAITHEQMAVANWCLPDGDPRKLTREDAKMLLRILPALQAAARSGLLTEQQWDDAHSAFYHAPRLAAKLAALLPPEDR